MTQPLLEVLADAGALAQRAADLMLASTCATKGSSSVALSGDATDDPQRALSDLAAAGG